jgi:Tol biopolymer transport system component
LDNAIRPIAASRFCSLLLESNLEKSPESWSPDGRFLLYSAFDPTTRQDLWVLPLDGERKPFVFLKTPSSERNGQFSPDGRWIAYTSDESGRGEVYVAPFGGASATSGSADGQRFLLNALGGQKASAPITLVTNWTADVKR